MYHDAGSNAANHAEASSIFKCEHCDRTCKNSAGLKLHVRACKIRKPAAVIPPLHTQEANTEPLDTPEDTTEPPHRPTLRDNYRCEFCDGGYATKGGLSTHQRKKHPELWNDKKKRRLEAEGPKQHNWVEGDYELICQAEDEFYKKKSPLGINQFIQVSMFPELSIEAIKGQRRLPKFKEFRLRRVASPASSNEPIVLPTTTGTSESTPDEEEETHTAPLSDFRLKLVELSPQTISDIKSKPYGEEILNVQSLLMDNRLSEAHSEAVSIFDRLAKSFPRLENRNNVTKGKTAPRKIKKRRAVDKRTGKKMSPSKELRRELYAMVQKSWSKPRKRSKIVNLILSDTLGKKRDRVHSTDELDAYWRGLFNKESPADNRIITNPKKIITELDDAINVTEVAEALSRANDAATGPDGVPLQHLKDVGAHALTILYNGIACQHKIPKSWKEARTVLIPKTEVPASPAEYRPISISSYYYRIYTSLLSRRISNSIQLSNRQKGFIKADGIRDNLVLLETLIADSKRTCSNLNLTFMDVKKAFDSVSHESVKRTLEWAGIPIGLRQTISDLYEDCSTNVGGSSIRVTRGVKQGDPLSSILFNLVIEMAMSGVSDSLGISYEGHRLFYMAFADDLVLLSRNQKTHQVLVNSVSARLYQVGLELHPAKCKSLAIRADGKRKTTFIDTDQKISINGSEIPSMNTQEWYCYLGIKIGATGSPKGLYLKEIRDLLERTTKAPLKPYQRMCILRTNILPKFNHRLMFNKVSCQVLTQLDKEIRAHVRLWLKLPKDVPNSAFYADLSSGGLGLLCLRQRIPLLKKQRIGRMGESEDPLVRILVTTEPSRTNLQQWSKRCRFEGKAYNSKLELSELTRASLWKTCDGKGLRTVVSPSVSRPSFRQLGYDKTSLKAAQQIGAIGVRLNCLNTPARKNRGGQNPPEYNYCDKCPGVRRVATLGHISQSCPATHGLRVKRHDKIVQKLKTYFEAKESIITVLVEPHLKCGTQALRKPDIIVNTGKSVEIIDVQVVSDQGIAREEDEDRLRKTDKYDTAECKNAAYHALGIQPGSLDCNVEALTITWRGNLAPHSFKLAKRLGFSSKLKYIVSDTLVDTWGCFVVWNKTGGAAR